MKRFAYKYATVQFMPDLETGEFANVGVVLIIPEKNIFSFKLELSRTKRLTHFFRNLDSQVYRLSIKRVFEELQSLSQAVVEGRLRAEQAFDMTVRPLETLIRFSESSVAMAKDETSIAEELFHRFVWYDFSRAPTAEEVFQRKLAKMVAEFDVKDRFKRKELGNEVFKVNFSLLQQKNAHRKLINRAIQPLEFESKEPNKIIEHANSWSSRFATLDELGMKPRDVLIPVRAGSFKAPEQELAWGIAKKHLENWGDLVSDEDLASIERFALD